MPHFGYGDPIGPLFGGIMFLIFLGTGLGLLYLVFSGGTRSRPARNSHYETILKERYARGEIDEDELEEKLTFLRSDDHNYRRFGSRLRP